MFKNKLFLLTLSILLLSSCSSIESVFPKLTSTPAPTAIQEAVASRVNPDKELYVLNSASLSKSGSIVAQSQANKDAALALRSQVRKEVEAIYKTNLEDMDAFSKSIVSPVVSDLTVYATDLIMKKVTQKGAWEDNSKIYSLLAVNKEEVNSISQKVFQNFIDSAVKKLQPFGSK
ncbi:MAG: hypothetical protein Q4A58_01740 [Fusobacterium sp.]|uniref:hypothetical protein n=1 Tax=Fusobacterium sp. TaxID=68766 RepID=UPI0026DACF6E|nr:hypothetical protein [Fusobacterium sp.]MDO4690007.1 hypothetical protein [Fusobacterium sp.]